jgi:hypothetical protein
MLCEELSSRGIKNFECNVSATNPISNSFWQNAGFKEVMKRYYKQI